MRNLNKYLLRMQPQLIHVNEAKAAWAVFRLEHGAAYKATDLLTHPDANYKFAKTPVPVYGLSLAPDKASGTYSVCDFSTPECRKGCVAYAGQGEAPNVLEGRVRKTQFLAHNPNAFVTLLHHEISKARKKHVATSVGVRLNAFSDLEWERIAPWIFTLNPYVEFYDYTARPLRDVPANYHITYSRKENTSDDTVRAHVAAGRTVAVVFSTKRGDALPATYLGADVIDGDENDARYGDAKGVIVGLRAKGRMRKNKPGGMVVQGTLAPVA
jgi:hypothetical protein